MSAETSSFDWEILGPCRSLDATLTEARRSVARIAHDAAREAEGYDLAGCTPDDGPHPYAVAQRELEWLIRDARRALAEVQYLRTHSHKWDDDDRCSVCGADGRA